ncbi:MAG: 3-hydroxyisobutyrate dehydrogenase [Alphaproteobacteria bacterium]|nr:MAG: 3-hydroxyisobutyrate dehydrogenase [Alphaproteobacteria bacterium]
MAKVCFIGLGVMGYPMAGHLSKAGHQVFVYNRTIEKAEKWTKEFKGQVCESPKDAANKSEYIFVCVGNDDDVLSVFNGNNGIISGISKNSILVDHTTASADLAKHLHKTLIDKKAYFIDAPVSGGQVGAEKGVLSIMCGGERNIFNKAEKIMSAYGKNISLIGEVGSGQLAKMVNQICIAGLVQGLSEGINFGVNANLDMKKVLDVIQSGAAGSWQMINRGETMVQNKFNFGFAVDWMRKDLMLCLDEARKNKSRLPITSLIDQFYAQVQENNGGRFDTSSLITLLKNTKV